MKMRDFNPQEISTPEELERRRRIRAEERKAQIKKFFERFKKDKTRKQESTNTKKKKVVKEKVPKIKMESSLIKKQKSEVKEKDESSNTKKVDVIDALIVTIILSIVGCLIFRNVLLGVCFVYTICALIWLFKSLLEDNEYAMNMFLIKVLGAVFLEIDLLYLNMYSIEIGFWILAIFELISNFYFIWKREELV